MEQHPAQPPSPVIIAEPDPHWATQFQLLARTLFQALGEEAVRIEHVGSTAVPDLAAKPIIDLVVVIPSLDRLPRVTARLADCGYRNKGEQGIAGRFAFRRGAAPVDDAGAEAAWPAHHLYVCAQDSRELARLVAFRDRLRACPALAAEYARLKRDLAERYRHDRQAYTDGKSDFVEAVLQGLVAGPAGGAGECGDKV